MISALLFSSSFLNFAFYIYAIGFVIALILEQIVKQSDNQRNIFIVETNRKYLWRQTWVININWFVCNIGLYFISRNMHRWVIPSGMVLYNTCRLHEKGYFNK